MNPIRPEPNSRTRQRFPKSHRLSKTAEFRQVFDFRMSVADEVLIVYGLPNQKNHGRLGLSVSRKVGKAHERNRWKRLIREVYRHHLPNSAGLDLVVIPRRGADCRFELIERSFPKLVERLQRKRKQRSHPA